MRLGGIVLGYISQIEYSGHRNRQHLCHHCPRFHCRCRCRGGNDDDNEDEYEDSKKANDYFDPNVHSWPIFPTIITPNLLLNPQHYYLPSTLTRFIPCPQNFVTSTTPLFLYFLPQLTKSQFVVFKLPYTQNESKKNQKGYLLDDDVPYINLTPPQIYNAKGKDD